MITSNISQNTIFFTKNEQCSCTPWYKTSFFIPFTPFFIPFYTLLYPFIPFYTRLYITTKHITSTHSALQPAQQNNIDPNSTIFKFILLIIQNSAPQFFVFLSLMKKLSLLLSVVLCALITRGQSAAEFYNKGVANYRKGAMEAALADFTRAIEIKPKFGYAYGNRAAVKYSLKDIKGAIADYDIALRINPEDGNSFSGRGTARVSAGDVQGGMDDLNKAIALIPADAGAYYSRGMAKISSGDAGGGCADLGKAAELGDARSAWEMKKHCQ